MFDDSLPDGWGKLIFDRVVRVEGFLPQQLSLLDRLAHVGNAGMGALTYKPDLSERAGAEVLDLDWLSASAEDGLKGEASDVLADLLTLNGSSAGTRTKVVVGFNEREQQRIEQKSETDEDLSIIFAPGSSLGGARLKASVLDTQSRLVIAKFPKESDDYSVEL